MAWQSFHVAYELLSPLHIGYRRVGNLQRTRYYVPARNLRGAVTEALTRRGFSSGNASRGDYKAIGKWVDEHCAFGYWFVLDGEREIRPCYAKNGLQYGDLSLPAFERRHLGSHVTTALDPATTSAEEGSLHEVEFIAPHDCHGNRIQVGGWLFLNDAACSLVGDEPKWRDWLGDLQVGGERRYGFGRLRLVRFMAKECPPVHLDGRRPCWNFEEGNCLPAHARVEAVAARGPIEPIVGRETECSDGFGRKLTSAVVCWEPGAVMAAAAALSITAEGIWSKEGS